MTCSFGTKYYRHVQTRFELANRSFDVPPPERTLLADGFSARCSVFAKPSTLPANVFGELLANCSRTAVWTGLRLLHCLHQQALCKAELTHFEFSPFATSVTYMWRPDFLAWDRRHKDMTCILYRFVRTGCTKSCREQIDRVTKQ